MKAGDHEGSLPVWPSQRPRSLLLSRSHPQAVGIIQIVTVRDTSSVPAAVSVQTSVDDLGSEPGLSYIKGSACPPPGPRTSCSELNGGPYQCPLVLPRDPDPASVSRKAIPG